MNMKNTIYSLGEYMIRKCGSSWNYCNGFCSSCYMSHTIATASTTFDPKLQGAPNYIIKERKTKL